MKFKSHTITNYLLVFFVLLTACNENIETSSTQADTNTAPLAEKALEPIDIAKIQYGKIETMINQAKLRVDSIEYQCTNGPGGGKIHFYRNNGKLMLLRHEYYAGDHFGATESYYLKNEHPIFIHLEESSWSFAGPENSDPMSSHSQDDINEFRFYLTAYEAGQKQESLKCLQKSYVIRSWIELPTNPDEVPNKVISCGNRVNEILEKFKTLVKAQAPDTNC